ncbi:MAG: hypothetical protein R2852_01260 [Bacteroidia bacterium]
MMTEEVLKGYLKLLQADMEFYKDSIKEVSDEIIKEGFSQYPLFIAHQEEVKLGELILDKEELGTNFTIQASTLEEFVERKIISKNNVQLFKKAYKDPKIQCCIFLITGQGAQFVFVPYQSKSAENKEEA